MVVPTRMRRCVRHARHHVGVARLADAHDLVALDADVRLDDAQGRVDPNFHDGNGNVLERLRALGVASVEMESFYLLHLAAHGANMRAATCAVVAE